MGDTPESTYTTYKAHFETQTNRSNNACRRVGSSHISVAGYSARTFSQFAFDTAVSEH